jgi:hypothetical protein
MSLRTRIAGGFRALFRSKQDDADLDKEMQQYFEAAVEHKMAEGLSREAATRAARTEVGSPEAVVGLVAAWFATQVLTGALYEVSPRDPLAFVGAAVVVAALSLIAAWIPAARAARVDPVAALKV